MTLYNVTAPVQPISPVRTLAWNATVRAGDDIKIAFTLVDEDCETPVYTGAANALLSLFREECVPGFWDYGWPHYDNDGPYGTASVSVPGVVQGDTGRINFAIPATQSAGLWGGRYRAFISVDQPDGVATEIEGLVQVRPHATNGLGNAPRRYLTIGQDAIGTALLPPRNDGGVPRDVNGFPLLEALPPVAPIGTNSAVLGQCVLGLMVLGGSPIESSVPASSVLGNGVAGQMILGTTHV